MCCLETNNYHENTFKVFRPDKTQVSLLNDIGRDEENEPSAKRTSYTDHGVTRCFSKGITLIFVFFFSDLVKRYDDLYELITYL